MSKRKDKTPTDELFSVVLFKENNMKLFECIPDCWFLDADKTFCYWPPKGRSYKLRAMNREKPDSSWVVSACVFVSGGYVAYNIGFVVAKEKSDQKFNTSSADDHLDELNFRRKHPVMALSKKRTLEYLFSEGEMSKSHESTAVESTSAVEIASAVVSASAVKISSGNILAETNDKVKTNRVQKRKAVHNNAKREAEVLKMQVGKDGKSTNGPLPLSKSRSRSISMDRRETHSPNLYGLPPSTSTNLQVSSFHSKQQRSRTQEKINEKQVGKDMRKPTKDPSISSKSRPRSISVDSRHATHSPDLKGRSTSNLSVSSFHVNQQRSRTRSRSSYSGSRRSSNRNSSKDTRSSRSHSQEHSLSPGKRSDHSNSRSYSSRSNKSLPSHRYSSQQHRSSSSRSRSPSINSIPNHHHNQRKQFHRRSNNRQRHSRSTSSRNSHGTSQQRSIVDIDRRMTRMEVTINKIFVMVGDVIKQTNKNLRLKNDRSNNAASKAEIPKNFAVPEFPLDRVNKLAIFNKMIKSKEIYDFMLQQEKDYCAPSKSSDNVVMTAYLKRFITLKLRCDIALKDPKGSQKLTLFGDYHRVYRFMIDVMKEGYLAYNKRIKSTEIHTILRTVWGRSNQMLQDERRKRNK